LKKIVKALLLGLNLLALTALSLSSHASETGSYQLDLPAQSCAESLTRLSEIADVMLLFPAKIAENIRANPVKGRYTLVEALDIMLDGTGLVGSFSDKNVLMISVDESKAVNKEKAMNTKKSLLSAIVGVLVGSGHHVAAQDTEEGSS